MPEELTEEIIAAYKPQKRDFSNIAIPQTLDELIELIAEAVHDEWAAGRMAEGWTYGPTRDDQNKKHPCLVPYRFLSDAEKAYDRATAKTTIAMMISLGYRIVKC